MRSHILVSALLFLLSTPVFADQAANDAAKLCDKLAAAADDKSNPTGVVGIVSADFGPAQAAAALVPCEAAHKAFADQPRYAFQYGRALRAKDGSDEAAFALLLSAAQAGHAVAMNHVGFSYDKGTGVGHDMVKAAEWYAKSAELGVANAQRNLGICYRDALGVSRDPNKASYWFEKSAAQGLDDAWVEWGVMYDSGIGVPQDFNKGAELFKKAAAVGNVFAFNNLGLLHETGEGVPQDDVKARQYYEQAVAKDFELAMVNLGRLYQEGRGGLSVDHAKAVALFEKAAEYGEPEGNARLAEHYISGGDTTRDVARGLTLLQKSIADGSYHGAYVLAIEQEKGEVVPKDLLKAADNYVLALERGSADANTALVVENGTKLQPETVSLIVENLSKRGAAVTKVATGFSPEAISYMQKLYSGNL